MELALDPNEARLLQQILTQYVSDTKEEIGKTENYNWRQDLKRDEAAAKALLKRLAQAIDDAESVEPVDRPTEPIAG
jgi:ABC-type anion transport system duplicated permease subunit